MHEQRGSGLIGKEIKKKDYEQNWVCTDLGCIDLRIHTCVYMKIFFIVSFDLNLM